MLSDPLNSRRIAAALAGQNLGHDVQVFEELGSTSDHVKELGLAGYPHGLVVFAEEQTQGRGRRENRWQSAPGQDLMFSILLRPAFRLELWPRLTGLVALALCRAIEHTCQLTPLIKWPNDVYLDGKKVAGILAETFFAGQNNFMVLGIGLNVNREAFAPELLSIATSLKLAAGASQPRERLAISLLQELNRLVAHWESSYDLVVQGIRERSYLLGRAVRARLDQQEVAGQAIGLNEEGHLILAMPGGETLVLSSAEQVRPE